MNDIVLSSLLNIFAILGAENKISRNEAESRILFFLTRYVGIRDYESYLTLYGDLRDFYDDYTGFSAANVLDEVCNNLLNQVERREHGALLLRILEFCSTNRESFDPHGELFTRLASDLQIDDRLYGHFVNFIDGVEDEAVRVREMPEDGRLKLLFVKEENTLFFTYEGFDIVMMNDVPVVNGFFQIWNQSDVMKFTNSSPKYYSTVMQLFEGNEDYDTIELCGRDINFRFDDGGGNGLHNFSFTLRSGQLVAIMGGSGVGKSTLLSILNGSIRPQEGSITINGHDISEPEAKAHIGFVPQDDLLIEELTVYQNLWFTAKLCFDKMSDEELDSKVMSVLTQLGLEQAAHLTVGSPINKYISGGQRKRLNIALELIREPAILFLDEPTSGLSSSDTEKVVNILKELTFKGKLIVVNIHQPSSEVYKLFDRLWLLDKGGRPVFDGNPIEAVSYFKKAANYADAEFTTCPTCGNVNPEIVLNIIDEKSLDSSGHKSETRKVSPEEWHRMYLDARPHMDAPARTDVPPTDQKRPGALQQFAIFLKRNISSKVTNLQYVLVTLLEAPLLAAICAFLTRFAPSGAEYSVIDNKNLVSYFFMAIIVAIFLGMSGSAEEIIKDRTLLKREKFLHLSYRSYISSKIAYMAGVCLIQTLLFILVGNAIMGLRGLFWVWWAILFVSAFLSGLIGLLLSQCLNSVVAIYITIPLLLIPQILLCGLVVKFSDLAPDSDTGNVPVIGDFIPSRWAYEALAVANFSMNAYEGQFFDDDREKYSSIYYADVFAKELLTRLETRRMEIESDDRVENPEHMELVRAELPYLAEVCGLDAYSGDWSYDSLVQYLESAQKTLETRASKAALRIDRTASAYIADHSKEDLVRLKRSRCNLQLENLTTGRDAADLCLVRNGRIVPNSAQIYLTPRSTNGRAPFYSGTKVIGGTEIPTFWFNIIVLLLMCAAVSVCLYTDTPGRLVRKERN